MLTFANLRIAFVSSSNNYGAKCGHLSLSKVEKSFYCQLKLWCCSRTQSTINPQRLENLKNIVEIFTMGKTKMNVSNVVRDREINQLHTIHHHTNPNPAKTGENIEAVSRRSAPFSCSPLSPCCHCSGVGTSSSLMKGHRSHAPPPWRGLANTLSRYTRCHLHPFHCY